MKEKRMKKVSRVKNDVCEIASFYDKCRGMCKGWREVDLKVAADWLL
jgi:hypothetical protein